MGQNVRHMRFMRGNELKKLLSAGIRERMLRLNISNKSIKAKTGWTDSYISLVKTGRCSPIERLDRWTELVKASPEFLIRLGRNSD